MKLYLAPLQGLTDHSFRKIFRLYFGGLDLFFTPFFSFNRNNPIKAGKLKKQLDDGYGPAKVVPQVLSNSPEAIFRFQESLSGIGYKRFNLNLGCPYPVVIKKNKGVALMSQPQRLEDLISHMANHSALSFSVKVRLGLENPDEIFTVLEILNRYPIEEVIIHPRLGGQYYKGEPDHARLNKCLAHSKHPLVYNGDIFSVADFQKFSLMHPDVNTFMLGRGILRNPFLAMQIKGEALPANPKKVLYDFQADLFYQLLEDRGKGKYFPQGIKEFWSYLSYSFDNPPEIFDQIKRVNAPAEYLSATDNIFSSRKLMIT